MPESPPLAEAGGSPGEEALGPVGPWGAAGERFAWLWWADEPGEALPAFPAEASPGAQAAAAPEPAPGRSAPRPRGLAWPPEPEGLAGAGLGTLAAEAWAPPAHQPWPAYPSPRLDLAPAPEAGPWAPPAALQARLLALARGLPCGFEELISAAELPFVPMPHQEAAVKRALGPLRGRALLADEVGLGKTIEAGLAWRELQARGLAERVLVLAPAPLLPQWQEELATKFGLQVQVVRQPGDWAGSQLLASLDLAKRPEHATEAWSAPFDLVIVDEAHRLHHTNTQVHRLVRSLAAKRLLLLTATPLRNNLLELHALAELLEPGAWGPLAHYANANAEHGDWRVARDPEGLRERLARLMVRHRRSEAGAVLPPRRVGTWWLKLPPLEAALYEEASDLLGRAAAAGDPGGPLVLASLQRALASGPPAAASMLARMARDPRREPPERSAFAGLAEQARALGAGRKVAAAVAYLEAAPTPLPAVVFTEFRASQAALVAALRERHFPAQALHGGLNAAERAKVLAQWKAEGGCLVATEAGAEGHNWQHAATVLNLELPWNPMRLEQRAGRVHRLGQKRAVSLIHLVAEGTLEAEIHELLATKLTLFGLVVGELEPILGGDQPVDLEAELARVALAPDRQAAMAALGDRLCAALAEHRAAQAATEAFMGAA